MYTIYRVRTQKFESYEKRLGSRKAHATQTQRPVASWHCCIAHTDPQIITQITGSWSMDSSILHHGLERQVTFYLTYTVNSDGSLCLELPIICGV